MDTRMEMTNETSSIGIILTGIGTILTAIGVPKVVENWKEARKHNYKHLSGQISTLMQSNEILSKHVERIDTKMMIIMPMLKRKYGDDEETIELLSALEADRLNINENTD